MEVICSKSQNTCISQFEDNKTIQYHKLCNTCRGRPTDINVDCSIYDSFNQLITYLHESIETNTQVLKVVEGERGSITYLIRQTNSYLVKSKK